MKTIGQKIPLLILLFSSLFIVAANAQAEMYNTMYGNSVSNKIDRSMLSAGAVLVHNQRLLDQSTIGYTLKTTTNSQAKDLLAQARKLFIKAVTAYHSGEEEFAKDLAYESISTFYKSDKIHYELNEN